MVPKLITRYVIWELTKIFLVSSFAFVLLMLIIGVADEARDRGLGPDILVQLIPYILPEALMYAMPATCLFSVCVVFGRMASDNEMIAVQSMGLHQSVIVFPILALTFLLSLFAVWVNDVSFAWSYWGIERVVMESSDKILYGVLEDEGNIKTSKFSIEVQGVEGRRLIEPVILYNNVRAVASEATLTTNLDTHSLEFSMVRGAVLNETNNERWMFDDRLTYSVPLKSPQEVADATGNPSHLYLSQISHEIVKQESEIEQANQANAIRAASQMLTGNMIGLTNQDWLERNRTQRDAKQRLGRLHMVPHRRWANGFSCLAFAMIGIPIALKLKTSNYATTFGICFIPILIMYYPLFMFGLNGAKQGTLPPFAAWLGNAVCMSLGAILMIRQFRR